jgi:pimeloyl-ACP methyl ester carboxylesterase
MSRLPAPAVAATRRPPSAAPRRIFYTHGLGGTLRAQPEIEEVFEPLGYSITRIEVPGHRSPAELAVALATMTFADHCLLIDTTANRLIEIGQRFAPEEYAVIGDSLGGLISAVAAQRDPRISHCVLLASSGDICDAIMNLDRLAPGFGDFAGAMSRTGRGKLKAQAQKAAAGRSQFQQEFELVNTLRPERQERIRRLLIVGDRGDPVMTAAAALRFAKGVSQSHVIMAYDEGRHHPIGKDALQRYVVPFLRGDRGARTSLIERLRTLGHWWRGRRNRPGARRGSGPPALE